MIIHEICENKRAKIAKFGVELGHKIPQKRTFPVNKIPHDSAIIIAEIKRKSPTKGVFDANLNAAKTAKEYVDAGASAISVLCEEDYFNGSLADLMSVREACPNAVLLRKDFLLSPDEIDISYRAGADMVLLIASVFMDNPALFGEMLARCESYGITPLVEIHNKNELDFVLGFRAPLLGINSRDLRNFRIDKCGALSLKSAIPQESKVIFESGIHSNFDAYLAASVGFAGILCGEYLITSRDKISTIRALKESLESAKNDRFYAPFFALTARKTPIIKICGVTNENDALLVKAVGADIVGFILSPSKRQIDIKALESFAPKLRGILKVGVILENSADFALARDLLARGVIDAIQLHSSTSAESYAGFALKNANFAFYSGFNIGAIDEIPQNHISPFILFDSVSEAKGGSGKAIDKAILEVLATREVPLCVSGGITADNVRAFLALKPTMLDICSGVESGVGKKDENKLKKLMKNIKEFA